MRTRLVVGTVGVVLVAYGAWLLLSRQDVARLEGAAVWLAAGVVLHDAVLAPLVVGFAVVARWLPRAAHGPAVVGLVVLGSVTLLAVPVLGRFGARADNPTLLDRPYWTGWVVLAGLVLTGVVVSTVLGARRGTSGRTSGRGAHGPGARR